MRHTILPKLSGVIACLALAACGSSQKPEGKVNFDLNTSVAHRKRAHDQPGMQPLYSPPMLWSLDVPAFYRT